MVREKSAPKATNILVVGATADLVQPALDRFASEQIRLALVARNEAELEAIARRLRKHYPKPARDSVVVLPTDSSDESMVDAAVTKLKKIWRRIDSAIVAIGATGIEGAVISPDQAFGDIDINALRRGMEVNFFMPMYWIKHILEAMADKPTLGRLTVFGSISALEPLSKVWGYQPPKAAMHSIVPQLAAQAEALRQRNKRRAGTVINLIVPGFFPAAQNQKLLMTADGGFSHRGQSIINRTISGRFGRAEELVEALHLLTVTCPEFMQASKLIVDGGFHGFSGVNMEPVPPSKPARKSKKRAVLKGRRSNK